MATTTFTGVVRSGPKGSVSAKGMSGSMIMGLPLSINPTAPAAPTATVLPAGAVVIGFLSDGGALDGTNPTLEIGNEANTEGYISNLASDSPTFLGANGDDATVATTSATTIWAGAGATAAPNGVVEGVLLYMLVDPKAGVNA